MTLLAAIAAGFLVWLAPHFHRWTTGGYWGVIGLMILAGALVGVSQLHGRDANPPGSFVVVFVPVAVAAGWVTLALQPQRDWVRNQILSWSGGIGIAHAVHNLGEHVAVLAFGLGIVFAVTFEPSLIRRARKKATAPVTLGLAASGVGSAPISVAKAGATIAEPAAEGQQTNGTADDGLDTSTAPPTPADTPAEAPTVVEPPAQQQQPAAWPTSDADASTDPSVSSAAPAAEDPTLVEASARQHQADAVPTTEVAAPNVGSVPGDPAQEEPTTIKPPPRRDPAGL